MTVKGTSFCTGYQLCMGKDWKTVISAMSSVSKPRAFWSDWGCFTAGNRRDKDRAGDPCVFRGLACFFDPHLRASA